MAAVLVAVWAALASIALSFIVVMVDEMQRPASNVRRMGAGLALVAGFAGVWLLITPISPSPELHCDAPALVLAEFDSSPIETPAECAEPMRMNAFAGLIASVVAPLAVFTTRGHKD